MFSKHFPLYQPIVILSIVLMIGALFFSLYAVKQIENEQISGAAVLIQAREADKKLSQIREARAQREEERRKEESKRDILPGGDGALIDISAQSFILARQDSALNFNVIYQKNAYQKVPIASLTKLMTALVVLENYNLDDIITVSKNSVETEGVTGGLVEGERLTVLDLLKIMLIESSNDAAESLAENFPVALMKAPKSLSFVEGDLGASRENFIALMNVKVEELGLENTRFANPTGLDDPENYSTANDLAKFVAAIMNDDTIWAITRVKNMTLQSQDGHKHYLKSSNRLLWELGEIYGGKTGFTDEARECMILVVNQPDGSKLISVVLGSEDRFEDTTKLISNF